MASLSELCEKFGEVCGCATKAFCRDKSLQTCQDNYVPMPCLSGIIVRKSSKDRKHQKKMYKQHVKGLFACLNEFVPDAASCPRKDDAKKRQHSGEAALYVVERIASLKGVLPTKYLHKVAKRLQECVPHAILLRPGRDFGLRCHLHEWSLDFYAAVAQEEEIEDIAQQEVMRMLLKFLRATQRAITSFSHSSGSEATHITQLRKQLFEYCYKVLMRLSTDVKLSSEATSILNEDENDSGCSINSIVQGMEALTVSTACNTGSENAIRALIPSATATGRVDLFLLLDELIVVGFQAITKQKGICSSKVETKIDGLKKILNDFASPSFVDTQIVGCSQSLWRCKLPLVLAKLSQIRFDWNHNNKKPPSSAASKEAHLLVHSFQQVHISMNLLDLSKHLVKRSVVEMFRSIVSHIRAMQQEHLNALSARSVESLNILWAWVRNALSHKVSERIVEELIPQCSDTIAKSVELAVVYFKRRGTEIEQRFADPGGVLDVVCQCHDFVKYVMIATTRKSDKDEVNDSLKQSKAERTMRFVSCFGRVAFLAAQALHEQGMHKFACSVATSSCQSCEQWLNLSESLETRLGKGLGKMKSILMHRYDFIRMSAKESGDPKLLSNALAAAIKSLQYSNPKEAKHLISRVQRVVGCEIALIKCKQLSEEKTPLLDVDRLPIVKACILIHAASAYRFYYRNNISGALVESENAKRLLKWCKNNHHHILSLLSKSFIESHSKSSLSASSPSSLQAIKLLCENERVHFLRERVASQGAEAPCNNLAEDEAHFNKILKNRKRVYKQADFAASVAADVQKCDVGNWTPAVHLLSAEAYILLALVKIEHQPKNYSDDSSNAISDARHANMCACDRAVTAVEFAAELSQSYLNSETGSSKSERPLWLNVSSLLELLKGFAYMLRLHCFDSLHLRYTRALQSLNEYFLWVTNVTDTTESVDAFVSRYFEDVSLKLSVIEREHGNWSVKKARKILRAVKSSHQNNLSVDSALCMDVCEVQILTSGIELTDSECARIKRLREKFNDRRHHRIAENNKTSQSISEQQRASALWAQSQCHFFCGQSVASLRYALMSLDIRKRLGQREGTLEASVQEKIDEAAAKNMKLTPTSGNLKSFIPIIRLDQWVLLHDFFLSLRQLVCLFTARGLAHKAEYWILQGLTWAMKLDLSNLVSLFQFDCKLLEEWTGRIIYPHDDSLQTKDDVDKHSIENLCFKTDSLCKSSQPVLIDLQQRRERAESEALKELTDGKISKSYHSYKEKLITSRLLRSCVDMNLNRDLIRGFSFSGAQLALENDNPYMSEAACTAIASMGLTYEMEYLTRRENSRQKQITNRNPGKEKTRTSTCETKSHSFTLFEDEADSIYDLQSLQERMSSAMSKLPENLRIVALSWNPRIGINVASCQRANHGGTSLWRNAFRRPLNGAVSQVMKSFDDIVKRSDSSTISSTIDPTKITKKFKAEWWETRRSLDNDMCQLVQSLQHICLDWTAAFTVGQIMPGKNDMQRRCSDALTRLAQEFLEKLECTNDNTRNLLHTFFSGCDVLTRSAFLEGFRSICEESCKKVAEYDSKLSANLDQMASEAADKAYEIFENYATEKWRSFSKSDLVSILKLRNLSSSGKKSDLVIRLCQNSMQRISLKECTLNIGNEQQDKPLKHEIGILERFPVILLLDAALQKLPWENMPCMRKCAVSRMPSFASIMRVYDDNHEKTDGEVRQAGRLSLQRDIGTGQAQYIINPGGDLTRTEKNFRKTFNTFAQSGIKWSGTFGASPDVDTYCNTMLPHSDMIVYCGHGSSEAFFSRKKVAESNINSAVVLMGCSSGKLRDEGRFDPHGMVHAYLMGGAPMVIANLWDVTDKDIDRFCIDLLERMLGKSGETNGEWNEDTAVDVLASMNSARNVCEMKWMIGAAPICYGVPLHVTSRK